MAILEAFEEVLLKNALENLSSIANYNGKLSQGWKIK
jgi:hypothetical protein